MQKRLKIIIGDDETIIINEERLKEVHEISSVIRQALDENSDLIVDIEPEDNAFYRGTRKAISGIVSAGLSAEQIRYKIDGKLITIDQLRERPSPWSNS